MYIHAAANSVMLQLYSQHDFRDINFKIKHHLYRASWSVPPPLPQLKILDAHLNYT